MRQSRLLGGLEVELGSALLLVLADDGPVQVIEVVVAGLRVVENDGVALVPLSAGLLADLQRCLLDLLERFLVIAFGRWRLLRDGHVSWLIGAIVVLADL